MHPHYQNHFPPHQKLQGLVGAKMDGTRIYADISPSFPMYSNDRLVPAHILSNQSHPIQFNFVQQPINQFQNKHPINLPMIASPHLTEMPVINASARILPNVNDKNQRAILLMQRPAYYQQNQPSPFVPTEKYQTAPYVSPSDPEESDSSQMPSSSCQPPPQPHQSKHATISELEEKKSTRSDSKNSEEESDIEPWTVEEDKLLMSLYEEMGSKWSAMTSYFTNRTRIQLKTRHKSICRAKTRMWTAEEDAMLIDKCKDHGQGTNWGDIVKFFPKRTKNSLRVRYRELTNTRFKIHKTPNLGSPFQALFEISQSSKNAKDEEGNNSGSVQEPNKKRKFDVDPKHSRANGGLENIKQAIFLQPQLGIDKSFEDQGKPFPSFSSHGQFRQ